MGSLSPGQGATSASSNVVAVQQASAMANNGVIIGVNKCLYFVRTVLGFQTDPVSPENGVVSAKAAWDQVPTNERYTDSSPPAGVPVYWVGGGSGYGHVALSAGGGQVYSTDFGPNGYIGDGRVRLTTIDAINKDKGLRYVGWSPYLGDTTTGNGTYGTATDTPGTGMSDSSGDDMSVSSSAASIITGPFTTILNWFKGGVERIAFFVIGLAVLLIVLHKAA